MQAESQQMISDEVDGGVQVDQPLKSIVHYTNYYSTLDGNDHKNRL